MSHLRRIKSDCVIIAMQEKMPLWAEAVGGPLSVSPALVEHLLNFGEQLDPDARPTSMMVACLRQVGKVLSANAGLGRAGIGRAELIGVSLTVSGETSDFFLGVRADEEALHLFAPIDLEDPWALH
ncbi:MAG: hypothetical protein RL748_1981 [Pseudomonadota bacterium]